MAWPKSKVSGSTRTIQRDVSTASSATNTGDSAAADPVNTNVRTAAVAIHLSEDPS